MNRKKLKAVVYIGLVLWIIAFVQIGITGLMNSDSRISQAFARNQLERISSSVELKVNLGDKSIDKKAWNREFGKEQKFKTIAMGTGNFLHTKVDTSSNMENMYETRDKFRSFLSKNNLTDYELATLTECRYKGNMTSEEVKKLVQRLFKQCSAFTIDTKEVDGYFVAYGYILSGYDSVIVNGKKVNINIAVNYDEEERINRVYIGTPILNIDF